MLYHMENISVFLIAVFLWLLQEMRCCVEDLAVFLSTVFFSCDFSWKCIFEWKTSPLLSSLFLFCVFVVNPPGNAFFYGGLSVFAIDIFCFVLFLTWLLLEMLYCMENLVFLITFFVFCFVVTSAENAFLYRGPLHLSHHCFLFVVNPPENALWYRRHLRFPQGCFCVLFLM